MTLSVLRPDFDPEKTFSSFKETAYRRAFERESLRLERFESAWRAAHRAAGLLKGRFSATKVAVFGSLLCKERFTLWSDVDIAAWGIAMEDTFRAIAEVLTLDDDMEINLFDVNICNSSIISHIEKTGVEL